MSIVFFLFCDSCRGDPSSRPYINTKITSLQLSSLKEEGKSVFPLLFKERIKERLEEQRAGDPRSVKFELNIVL